MYRTLLTIVLLSTLAGCQSNPFRVLMRGDINGDVGVNGNVGIAGDLGIDGALKIEGDLATSIQANNTASKLAPVVIEGHTSASQRVAVIDVDGLLVNRNLGGMGSLGENPVALFREKLRYLEQQGNLVGVVLRIDSPGGGVTATDIMSRELQRFKQRTGLPVIACLMSNGAGGAYYLATHADQIIAHPTSVVGGIGVILNLYNMEDTLGQYNIAAIPVKAGNKIDGGSPVRMMGEDERAMLQEMADSFHERFKEQVRRSRMAVALAPQPDWFDGRVMTGQAAEQAGLVDQIGYLDDAIDLVKQTANAPGDAAVIMLRRDNDRAYTALDVTPNTSAIGSLLPISIPGLERSELPTFMYLWQADPSLVTSH